MHSNRITSVFLFVIIGLTLLAAATTTVDIPPQPTATPVDQCPQGNLQCCNSLERSDSTLVGLLLGLLGVVIQGVEGLIGITCSPIDILGIGQNTCSSEAVCCINNDFNGIIAIGCVPVNINL